MFRKLDLFPSSGDERKIPTLLGPIERANLSRWAKLPKCFLVVIPDDGPKGINLFQISYRMDETTSVV
jgi:hypothetical protein